LQTRGLLVAQPQGRKEVFTVAHPALRGAIRDFAIAEHARATIARRALTRRIATGDRLRVPELVAVHRHLRGTLTPPERVAVRRSLGAAAMRISLGVALALLIVAGLYADTRRAYSVAFDPPEAGPAARVVVRLGRPRTSFSTFSPTRRRWVRSSPTPGTRRAAWARRRSRASRAAACRERWRRPRPGACPAGCVRS
jgi:hypothetical protein